ncbi:ribonuclease P protein component [Thermomonas sp.]|uniref:ribonuclease P protein component n=1 Tax=Thermomonas sp. TaxID=1971895 RepID=UPI002486F446|nr:ribonuclease P protein component [Thermomonas sp.]MDI1252269.1 ribonuclease P protein component [Thermomonas sp.]
MIATSPPQKPAPAGFPRLARVRAKAEFDRVFGEGRRIADPMLSLHLLADQQSARLGLAVSRKVDPDAVGRNRIKRVMRDAFRQNRSQLAPGAYVLVARVPAGKAANTELRTAFLRLLQRAGALPMPPMDGTMPPATPSLPQESAALMRRPSPPVR